MARRSPQEWSPRGVYPAYSLTRLPPHDENVTECVIPDQVAVVLTYIGEAASGDEWVGVTDAPEGDFPILRFYVEDLQGHRSEEYNSYSTLLPVTLPFSILKSVCEEMADILAPLANWKRTLQEMSWWDEGMAQNIHRRRTDK